MLQEVVIKATNEEKIEMVKNGEYPLDQFLRDNDGLVYKIISIYEFFRYQVNLSMNVTLILFVNLMK